MEHSEEPEAVETKFAFYVANHCSQLLKNIWKIKFDFNNVVKDYLTTEVIGNKLLFKFEEEMKINEKNTFEFLFRVDPTLKSTGLLNYFNNAISLPAEEFYLCFNKKIEEEETKQLNSKVMSRLNENNHHENNSNKSQEIIKIQKKKLLINKTIQ